MDSKKHLVGLVFVLSLVSLSACFYNQSPSFVVLEASRTGLNFKNTLKSYPDFNMFKYMYFFNGAGIGCADFNNDGLSDLFFASNQGQNKLFLNQGNLNFKDITNQTNIPQDSAWSTGVSVVDINADGLMDIYVSRVGNFERLQSKNQFLICSKIENGIPTYEDKAAELGLDFSAFGTQAAFFDYDLDGDLDMYMMNHSLRYNGTYQEKKMYDHNRDSLSGDRLMKNEKGYFIDVSEQAGIKGNIIGYGLGLCIADVNMDGLQDIYVGNDFHENDYLYINNGDGTFSDKMLSCIQQTSQFSMGVDIADINNDGLPEIVTMDMLPSDPYLLKRSLGEDSYDLFNHKIKFGYHYQYARNTLQLNRGNEKFSEIGRYAGIHATDWSWSSLFLDFDNDGLKDIFISNGIPKRMNDIDYIKFISDESFQQKIKENNISDQEINLLNQFPEIKLSNPFFKNKGDARFERITEGIKNDKNTFSNGAVYADFDNDGDLDIVVNNIEDFALLYENKQNEQAKNNSLTISLKGYEKNIHAIGTKIVVYNKGAIKTFEKTNVRGFMSSMETPLLLGLGEIIPDSIHVVWPDNRFDVIHYNGKSQTITLNYKKDLAVYNYSTLLKADLLPESKEITSSLGLEHFHQENPFIEFDREPLIPHMVSREGPALVVDDVNNDGLDDFYVGSCKFDTSALYIQTKQGMFVKSSQTAFIKDANYEDVDARFADLNKDGFVDLIVASGGNEYSSKSPMLKPRVYLNDRYGNFKSTPNAIAQNVLLTASCVSVLDMNGDGHLDLFFGGRAIPWEYGSKPRSFVLLNNGQASFTIDQKNSDVISDLGFITSSTEADINNDGRTDLLLTTEWNGIYWFNNAINGQKVETITSDKGWWNIACISDVDNDGDQDILAGNLGLNNKFNASLKTPLTMYVDDFDENGTIEQFLTYFQEGKEIPFNTHEELLKQLPVLKKKYLFAEDFAKANVQQFFAKKLSQSKKYQTNNFSSMIFENMGKQKFEARQLPWQAQLSTIKCILPISINGDKLPDFLIAGNFFHNNIQMGRYDSEYGSILINQGGFKFKTLSLNQIDLLGEVRKLKTININNEEHVLVGKNNDYLKVIKVNLTNKSQLNQ